MRAVAPLVLILAAACTKPAAPPDAGTVIERGTDLRSAVTTVFPEWRGVQLIAGRCAVIRTVKPAAKADLDQALETAKKNGFVPSTDDAGTPHAFWRSPFALELRPRADSLELEVRLGLNPDELGRVLAAPQAMTTEALAHWLPKVAAPKVAERFELELVWTAQSVQRADFLVWQLVDGALAAGWTADGLPQGWHLHGPDGGGAGAVPEDFTLVIRQVSQGMQVTLTRKGERAHLAYALTTFERR